MTAVCVMEAVFESEHVNTIIISIEICTLLLQSCLEMVFAGSHSKTVVAYGSPVAIIHY
jgi:hypothetical protein